MQVIIMRANIKLLDLTACFHYISNPLVFVSASLPLLHYYMSVYARSEGFYETLHMQRLIEPSLLANAMSAKILLAFSFFRVLLM